MYFEICFWYFKKEWRWNQYWECWSNALVCKHCSSTPSSTLKCKCCSQEKNIVLKCYKRASYLVLVMPHCHALHDLYTIWWALFIKNFEFCNIIFIQLNLYRGEFIEEESNIFENLLCGYGLGLKLVHCYVLPFIAVSAHLLLRVPVCHFVRQSVGPHVYYVYPPFVVNCVIQWPTLLVHIILPFPRCREQHSIWQTA